MSYLQLSPRVSILLPILLISLIPQFSPVVNTMADRRRPAVPAVIAFGDSIIDPGNNNALETIVRCDFPPYGKDFPGHRPTGRFSNGKIPTDFLVSKLGIKEFLPAYLSEALREEDLLSGVSFASGGSGFDPLTSQLVSVISLHEQLMLFKEYKEKLKTIAGETKSSAIVSESLYVICAGTDDIINTYFGTLFRRAVFDISSYVSFLVSSAAAFVEELWSLGARRIAFVGLPPIGCLPSQRTLRGGLNRDCYSSFNEVASQFNSKMREKLQKISNPRHGRRTAYFDVYYVLLELIKNPSIYGFDEETKGCCGTGVLEVSVLCTNSTTVSCKDNTRYVFWDSFHPTERTYDIITERIVHKLSPILS